jgi:GNAT superfamily N-acetyltransferase
MIKIRPATPDDAPAMARVIVDTWFAAHKGQVSDEAFQQRRDEWGYKESEQGWRRTIPKADGVSAQMLVATDEGQVIAVAASDVTGADCAEVGSLYVDVSYQRSGIGRRLVEATIDHYRSLGIATPHIAVLATNQPARRFYETLGGRNAGTRDDPDGLEIVYAWDLADMERNAD